MAAASKWLSPSIPQRMSTPRSAGGSCPRPLRSLSMSPLWIALTSGDACGHAGETGIAARELVDRLWRRVRERGPLQNGEPAAV